MSYITVQFDDKTVVQIGSPATYLRVDFVNNIVETSYNKTDWVHLYPPTVDEVDNEGAYSDCDNDDHICENRLDVCDVCGESVEVDPSDMFYSNDD